MPAPLESVASVCIDAVSTSVDATVHDLVKRLNRALGTIHAPARPLPGRGYDHAAALVNPNTLAERALVMYGAAHEKPHVYAVGTEHYDAPAVYAALQSEFSGVWAPSRLDAAIDFQSPEWFDLLSAKLTDIAVRRDVALSHQGDWTRNKGRTLYVGSRQSPFFIRLYEFKQHHGYGPDVRLELEIKVKAKLRPAVAAASPGELFGMSPVLHELLTSFDLDCSRTVVSPGARAPTSVDRDLAFLARQAWPAFARLVSHFGTPAAALQGIVDYRTESERIRQLLTERVTMCDTLGELRQSS